MTAPAPFGSHPDHDAALARETAALASDIIDRASGLGRRLGCVESCTGGLVAAALTDIPGSSAAFERGIVSYSNAAKQELAGVPAGLIAAHGAVSEACARAMAAGLREAAGLDVVVSVTGIAGPGGGTPEKPVGLVWFALAGRGGVVALAAQFGDQGRSLVRRLAVRQALLLFRDHL